MLLSKSAVCRKCDSYLVSKPHEETSWEPLLSSPSKNQYLKGQDGYCRWNISDTEKKVR